MLGSEAHERRNAFIPFKNQALRPTMSFNAKFIFIGLGAYALTTLAVCIFYVILRLAVFRARLGKIDDEEMQDFEKQEKNGK
jgi:hypothetical protein